jgi:hypothetical protein
MTKKGVERTAEAKQEVNSTLEPVAKEAVEIPSFASEARRAQYADHVRREKRPEDLNKGYVRDEMVWMREVESGHKGKFEGPHAVSKHLDRKVEQMDIDLTIDNPDNTRAETVFTSDEALVMANSKLATSAAAARNLRRCEMRNAGRPENEQVWRYMVEMRADQALGTDWKDHVYGRESPRQPQDIDFDRYLDTVVRALYRRTPEGQWVTQTCHVVPR